MLDAFVLSLEGEFDIAERQRLLDAFALTAEAPVVILDFAKTRYVDSTVLECLIGLNRKVAERGARLILGGLTPPLRRIFQICDLERRFDIREGLNDAIAFLDLDPARTRRLTVTVEPGGAPEAIEVRSGKRP